MIQLICAVWANSSVGYYKSLLTQQNGILILPRILLSMFSIITAFSNDKTKLAASLKMTLALSSVLVWDLLLSNYSGKNLKPWPH